MKYTFDKNSVQDITRQVQRVRNDPINTLKPAARRDIPTPDLRIKNTTSDTWAAGSCVELNGDYDEYYNSYGGIKPTDDSLPNTALVMHECEPNAIVTATRAGGNPVTALYTGTAPEVGDTLGSTADSYLLTVDNEGYTAYSNGASGRVRAGFFRTKGCSCSRLTGNVAYIYVGAPLPSPVPSGETHISLDINSVDAWMDAYQSIYDGFTIYYKGTHTLTTNLYVYKPTNFIGLLDNKIKPTIMLNKPSEDNNNASQVFFSPDGNYESGFSCISNIIIDSKTVDYTLYMVILSPSCSACNVDFIIHNAKDCSNNIGYWYYYLYCREDYNCTLDVILDFKNFRAYNNNPDGIYFATKGTYGSYWTSLIANMDIKLSGSYHQSSITTIISGKEVTINSVHSTNSDMSETYYDIAATHIDVGQYGNYNIKSTVTNNHIGFEGIGRPIFAGNTIATDNTIFYGDMICDLNSTVTDTSLTTERIAYSIFYPSKKMNGVNIAATLNNSGDSESYNQIYDYEDYTEYIINSALKASSSSTIIKPNSPPAWKIINSTSDNFFNTPLINQGEILYVDGVSGDNDNSGQSWDSAIKALSQDIWENKLYADIYIRNTSESGYPTLNVTKTTDSHNIKGFGSTAISNWYVSTSVNIYDIGDGNGTIFYAGLVNNCHTQYIYYSSNIIDCEVEKYVQQCDLISNLTSNYDICIQYCTNIIDCYLNGGIWNSSNIDGCTVDGCTLTTRAGFYLCSNIENCNAINNASCGFYACSGIDWATCTESNNGGYNCDLPPED